MHFWRWLFRIRNEDEEAQRLGRNVVAVALGMIALALAFVPVTLLQAMPLPALMALGIGLLAFVAAIVLARRGWVMPAAWLLVTMTLVAIVQAIIGTRSGQVAFYLMLPVLLAGVVLQPWQIWLALLISELGLWLAVLLTGAPWTNMAERQAVLGGALLMVIVALLSFLTARGTVAALADARLARDTARRAWESLAAANAELESTIAARTAELRAALEQQQAQKAALEESLVEQQRLHETIARLSLPVLPIRHDTLVAPLVGTLDADRAQRLLSQVLGQVERRRARWVVLDVTGLATVNDHVAATLVQTAAAARLLGAEPWVVGIRPEMAQALSALQVSLAGLHTAPTLQQALQMLEHPRGEAALASPAA